MCFQNIKVNSKVSNGLRIIGEDSQAQQRNRRGEKTLACGPTSTLLPGPTKTLFFFFFFFF
jgi:hypothetical protein